MVKQMETYLWINDEYFALWDTDLSITELIGVSVPEARVEGVVIRREKCSNILSN